MRRGAASGDYNNLALWQRLLYSNIWESRGQKDEKMTLEETVLSFHHFLWIEASPKETC